MRALTVTILSLILVACDGRVELPLQPPVQQRPAIKRPALPKDWEFSPRLAARSVPSCPDDPVAREAIAFIQEDVSVDLEVTVNAAGEVVAVRLADTLARDASRGRIARYAAACVQSVTFERPAFEPYAMKVPFQFTARRRTWPE
jgi:hypothetical protein